MFKLGQLLVCRVELTSDSDGNEIMFSSSEEEFGFDLFIVIDTTDIDVENEIAVKTDKGWLNFNIEHPHTVF